MKESKTVMNFFHKNPVFTSQEFYKFMQKRGVNKINSQRVLLSYHCRKGHVQKIRKGLYMSSPFGEYHENWSASPFLIAAKMSEDAVLAYHSALDFYGKAQSIYSRIYFLTKKKTRRQLFKGIDYFPTKFRKSLIRSGKELFAVKEEYSRGIKVLVTSLERTFVDLFDRPDYGGGWEEIWRSLEFMKALDIGKIVEYALLLGNATTIGKVGFYLEAHRERLWVEDSDLDALRERKPVYAQYFDQKNKNDAKLNKTWNLIIPRYVEEEQWGRVI
jgi:predicted transcriptional regulator of viral defense system